jgi:hypothetical protein
VAFRAARDRAGNGDERAVSVWAWVTMLAGHRACAARFTIGARTGGAQAEKAAYVPPSCITPPDASGLPRIAADYGRG